MLSTIRFGSEVYTRTYNEGTTFQEVLSDHDLKVVAGWGDNVRALVCGVEQSLTAIVPDGATIVVETRANTKAILA